MIDFAIAVDMASELVSIEGVLEEGASRLVNLLLGCGRGPFKYLQVQITAIAKPAIAPAELAF